MSGSVLTQLIAHDKEVHDIAFTKAGNGRDLFSSVGGDGSVRMFDLRYVRVHRSLSVHAMWVQVRTGVYRATGLVVSW